MSRYSPFLLHSLISPTAMVATSCICFENRNKKFPVIAVSMMPTLTNKTLLGAWSPQTFCDSERHVQLNWSESCFAVFHTKNPFLDVYRIGIDCLIKPRKHPNHINRNWKVFLLKGQCSLDHWMDGWMDGEGGWWRKWLQITFMLSTST